MASTKLPPLVEGVDYYMEDDKFVFTATYHLKRGFCCNARCRHCPYQPDSQLPPVRVIGLPGKPSGNEG